MNIQQTSLEAYRAIRPHLNEMQERILDVFMEAEQALCDQEISAITGYTINRVTPRRGELEDKGLITKAGSTTLPSGRRAYVYLPTLRGVLTR